MVNSTLFQSFFGAYVMTIIDSISAASLDAALVAALVLNAYVIIYGFKIMVAVLENRKSSSKVSSPQSYSQFCSSVQADLDIASDRAISKSINRHNLKSLKS